MKQLFTFLSILALMLNAELGWGQVTYYSQGSVAPNLTANWNTNRAGGGSTPSNFTTANNTFVIQNGHTMTTSGTWSISGSSTKLQIEDGGILIANHAITLSSNTTFQIDDGGRYIHNNTTAFATSIFQGIESFSAQSVVEFWDWNSTGPIVTTFGTLRINPPSQPASAIQFGGNTTTINGNLEIFASGTTTVRDTRLSSTTSLNLSIAGDLIVSGTGSLDFASGAGTSTVRTVNIGGSFIQTGGTVKCTGSSNPVTISFTGLNSSFTQSGGTLTNNNINWRINDGASLTLNNNLPVETGRTLTVGQGSSGILNCVNSQVTGLGSIVTQANSTLKTAHTSGINGNLSVASKTLNAATNFIFAGTSDQVTGSLITYAKNVTLENTAGKVSLSNGIAISGTLTIPSGAKFDAGSNVVSGTGNIDLQSGGKFITSNTSGLNGNNTTTGGSSSYSSSADYEFNASGAQSTGTFLPATVNNLSTSGTSALTISNTGLLTVSNNLSIGSGTSLQVGNDQSLTVSGTLSNSGTLTIKSDASGTGSLIHSSSGVSATVERYVAGHGNVADAGWHLMGSPVATFNISGSSFVPGTNDDLYGWSESTNTWLNYKAGNPTQIVPGTGYLIAYQTTGTKTFSGNLNVSDVSVTGLEHTAAQGKGWHLLGNPFASALQWNKTGGSWALTNIAGTAKVWNSTSKAYNDVTADGIIPSAQGFFVQVNVSTTGSLTIPASARTHSSTAWYKSTTPRILLSASPADGSSKQESQILINPEATASFDFYHDSRFLPGYAPQLYSLAGTEMLSTNALPQITNGTALPFGFVKNQHSSFVIRLEENSSGETVFLKDLKLNITHNLTQQPEYLFNAAEGDEPNRFLIVFGTVGIGENPTQQTSLQASMHNGQLWVNNPSENSLLSIHDLSGRLLQQTRLQNSGLQQLGTNLKAGAYIIRLQGNSQTLSTKVINR